MKLEYEGALGTHWLAAIVNDDPTGLSDDEHSSLLLWMDANDINAASAVYGESYFGHDPVSGLGADVVDVELYGYEG